MATSARPRCWSCYTSEIGAKSTPHPAFGHLLPAWRGEGITRCAGCIRCSCSPSPRVRGEGGAQRRMRGDGGQLARMSRQCEKHPSSGLRPPSPRMAGRRDNAVAGCICCSCSPSPRVRGEGGAQRRMRGDGGQLARMSRQCEKRPSSGLRPPSPRVAERRDNAVAGCIRCSCSPSPRIAGRRWPKAG